MEQDTGLESSVHAPKIPTHVSLANSELDFLSWEYNVEKQRELGRTDWICQSQRTTARAKRNKQLARELWKTTGHNERVTREREAMERVIAQAKAVEVVDGTTGLPPLLESRAPTPAPVLDRKM